MLLLRCCLVLYILQMSIKHTYRGRRGRMVVGFTATYAISAYHH